MELQIGKTYATRNGGRVEIVEKRIHNKAFPFVGTVYDNGVEKTREAWTRRGKHSQTKGETSPYDIIGEHVPRPEVTGSPGAVQG